MSHKSNTKACLNSWAQNKGERNLWMMIVKEREQKQLLNDQIKRTNKLARTVMAMTEDNGIEDEKEDNKEASNLAALRSLPPSLPRSLPPSLALGDNKVEGKKDGAASGAGAGTTDFVAEFSFLLQLKEMVKAAKGDVPSSNELASKVPECVIL